METRFHTEWKRPIHLDRPNIQTDRGGLALPEVNSREEAFVVVERWKPWMRENMLFDIFLVETNEDVKMKITIEFPIVLK